MHLAPRVDQAHFDNPFIFSPQPLVTPSMLIDDMLTSNLLIILVRIVVDDVKESELVHALGGGDHTQPISQLLLLEEFLRQIL